MPFCTNCGNQVGNTDVFCGKCGTRQGDRPTPPPRRNPKNPLDGINARTASILCYVPIFGWMACVVVLAVDKFRNDRTVRFHAFQGLYLFVIWLLVDWVVSPVMAIVPGPFGGMELTIMRKVLHAAVFCAWIFMLVKVSQEQHYHLPIVGELAERSISEQR